MYRGLRGVYYIQVYQRGGIGRILCWKFHHYNIFTGKFRLLCSILEKNVPILSEICLHQYDPEWKVELTFTCYFIVYFFWWLFGRYNHREFWLNIKTIIDIITTPHIFVSVAVNRDWLGIQFLHIVWFNHIIDFLRLLSIFKSQQRIDILSLISYFLTL